MEKIFAQKRKIRGNKSQQLREKNLVPAILYGKSVESILLTIDKKNFLKTYNKVGTSSMVELVVDDKKHLVLIYDTQKNTINGKIIHVDFYQPQLKEKIVIKVPLVFVGESPAVKEFNGTFVSNIKEIEIKALPLDLPHDIKVDISTLKTLDDHITIGDLKISDKLEIIQDKNFVVAMVSPPEDVDAELKKEIGDVESVEVAESKKDKKKEKEGEGEKEEEKKEGKKTEKKDDKK